MGQAYSAPIDNYRRSSKKAAKKLGVLPNKRAVAHYLNRAPKETKVCIII